jgi:HPt (histidine-containing phosphotransfer) domain-containing protein
LFSDNTLINNKVVFLNIIKQLDDVLIQGYVNDLGIQIVQKMLDLYTQQSIIYLEEINKAVNDKSQQGWTTSCHKMKGAAGSVGLVTVFNYLVKIEKSVEPWQQKTTNYVELFDLNDRGILSLKEYLNTKKASD